MKVVIAPDSFKGSLSATEVCDIVRKAFSAVDPSTEILTIPMADGGEGTLDALINATAGTKVSLQALGPLLEPVDTEYGVLGSGVEGNIGERDPGEGDGSPDKGDGRDADSADNSETSTAPSDPHTTSHRTVVIEMANIAGLTMVPEEQRDPTQTSTYGVGQVLKAGLDAGYRDFVVGVGGSATNDGGLGFLQALGGKFLDAEGQEVKPVGESLRTIHSVNLTGLDQRLSHANISVACDVDNPLCGHRGASAVFGPQKGATPEIVAQLDAGLAHYASLVEEALDHRLQDTPGAGAAGGLGFGLLVAGAKMESGARLMATTASLETALEGTDYVITGEGRSDEQTLYGKVPYVVAQIAEERGVNAILLSGSLDGDMTGLEPHFLSLHSILSKPMTVAEAMTNAQPLLYFAARNLAALLHSSSH